MLGLIDIQTKKGNADGVLSESERFLEKFPNSDMRHEGDAGRDRRRAQVEEARQGARARQFAQVRARPRAIRRESSRFSRRACSWRRSRRTRRSPSSKRCGARIRPLRSSRDALVLEAELRDRAGAPLEAARLYNLALMGNVDRDERLRLNARLAELSAARLADTLSAIRYWRLVADEDRDGSAAEEAIYRESVLREKIGDVEGATRGFDAIVSRFPEGQYAAQARDRLRALSPEARLEREHRQAASRGSPRGTRGRRSGRSRRGRSSSRTPATPRPRFRLSKGALAKELSDSLRAKGSYYLGTARLMRSDAAAARGEDANAERARGLDMLKERVGEIREHGVGRARLARSTSSGAQANGASPSGSAGSRNTWPLYGTRAGQMVGAHEEGAQYLSERASQGDTVAANAALAAANEVLASSAPAADKKEAMLLGASLMRAKGDHAGAARAYERLRRRRIPDDPRVTGVLYDLGEALLAAKDYAGAAAAYDRCIARAPGRAIAEKCLIRKGDCLYYRSALRGGGRRLRGIRRGVSRERARRRGDLPRGARAREGGGRADGG